MFTNHILLSISPLLMLSQSTSTRLSAPFPLFSRSCQSLFGQSFQFGRLGRSPKTWWSQKAESALREPWRARSEAHWSEAHRLRFIDASRRASSVISRIKSATWQATWSNLFPRSGPRAVFRLLNAISGKKNILQDFFPVAVPLLTLPITIPLIFAHIYLKRHPVPHAESNDSSWINCGKLAVRMLLPFTIHSAPLLLGWTLLCHKQTLLFHCIWPWPDAVEFLLLSLFDRSWSSHTFPSSWKPSTIIPIHKRGKPTSSQSSFRPISLTSCIYKLFELLILSRLTFHLESNHLLSTCQAGFCPGRSSLDHILTLYQSIWDGFQKKKPPNRTILASVDFSKTFHSVWHSALFHKLLSLKLPPCFVLWVRSFLSDHRAKFQVGGSHSLFFRIRWGVPHGWVLGPVLFIGFLMTSLRIFLGMLRPPCTLTIWPFGPPPQTRSKHLLFPILPPSPKNVVQLMETSSQSKEVWVLLFLYRWPSSYFPAPAEPPGHPPLLQSHP